MPSVEYLKKYSKLVKVLRILSQVTYWLSTAAVAILLPLAIYLSVSKQWCIVIGVPGNFRLGYIDGVIRYNLAFAAGAVTPEHANAILVQILFSIVVFAAVYGAISFFLSGVLKAIENGEPFQRNNARRIFSIGLIYLGGSLFVGTAQASAANVIIHAMRLTEALTVNYSANSIMIVAGLLMLILSGIFRYGFYLQEEYDATL
ncbi:MAG: DUF2975 domain-containing protein [Clostridiaceae bacterium]|nr:DUF2975 domain-containing protein [Clostridiaceae bacterium]